MNRDNNGILAPILNKKFLSIVICTRFSVSNFLTLSIVNNIHTSIDGRTYNTADILCSIFPSSVEARKNENNVKNVRSYYMLTIE